MYHRLLYPVCFAFLVLVGCFTILSTPVVATVQADHSSEQFTYQMAEVVSLTKTPATEHFTYTSCISTISAHLDCRMEYYSAVWPAPIPEFPVDFHFELAPPPEGTVGLRVYSLASTTPEQDDNLFASHFRAIACWSEFNECVRGNGNPYATVYENIGPNFLLIGMDGINYNAHGVNYDQYADRFNPSGTKVSYNIYLTNRSDYAIYHRVLFVWVIDPSLVEEPPSGQDTSFNPAGLSCWAVIDDSGTITNVSELTGTVEPPSANLLQNYSFESGMDSWQTAVNGSDPMISFPCGLDCRFGTHNAFVPANFSASACQSVALPPLTDTWDVFFGVNHRELVTSTLTIGFGGALSGLSSFSLGQFSAHSSTMTAPSGTATFCIHSSGTLERFYDAAWVAIRPSSSASTNPNSNTNFICIDPSSTITDTPAITSTVIPPATLPPTATLPSLPTLPVDLTVTPFDIPAGFTPHPTRCSGWAERRVDYDFNLPLSPISVTISNTLPGADFCFEPQEFVIDTSGSLSFLEVLGLPESITLLFSAIIGFTVLRFVRNR